jgi:hypothetical protein
MTKIADYKEYHKEYSREYQKVHKQGHRDRQKTYTKRLRARAGLLLKMYKDMKLWLKVKEDKGDNFLTEEERIIKREYLKLVDMIENNEELGVKKK